LTKEQDRELQAFKYDCPSFLNASKGVIPSILFTCVYDLSVNPISTIQCELFNRNTVNLIDRIGGGFTGTISYTYDDDLDYTIILMKGVLYFDLNTLQSEIIVPLSAIVANGYNPDIRLEQSFLYLLKDKEKCFSKYKRFVVDCDNEVDCGFGETGLMIYGHFE
jgi:hypothetical protein